MAKANKLEKPVPRTKAALDWNEVQDFIERKHKIKLRGYKEGEVEGYRDFWHWIIDHNEIHNGCYFWLPDITEYQEYGDRDGKKWWVEEILKIICEEFPDQNLYFYASW